MTIKAVESVEARFQPTLPLRGATAVPRPALLRPLVSTHAPLAGSDQHRQPLGYLPRVSTHAPLAGSDPWPFLGSCQRSSFNPRSPCGERLSMLSDRWLCDEFQPTLPLRGATSTMASSKMSRLVSTHAPLAGSDAGMQRVGSGLAVSTHAPLAGSDMPVCSVWGLALRFQPTLPLRGATFRSSTLRAVFG